MSMREIDVFGTRLLADHRDGRWTLFHPGVDGKRRVAHDLMIPAFIVSESDLVAYLADLCHEAATPAHDQVRWVT